MIIPNWYAEQIDLASSLLRWVIQIKMAIRYLVFDGWLSIAWFLHELDCLCLWWISKIHYDRLIRRLDGQVTVNDFANYSSLFPIHQLGVEFVAYWAYLLLPIYDQNRSPLSAKFVVVLYLREGDDEGGETIQEARYLKVFSIS